MRWALGGRSACVGQRCEGCIPARMQMAATSAWGSTTRVAIPSPASVQVAVTAAGTAHALVVWWELRMDAGGGARLSTAPCWARPAGPGAGPNPARSAEGDGARRLSEQAWRDHWTPCWVPLQPPQRLRARPLARQRMWHVSPQSPIATEVSALRISTPWIIVATAARGSTACRCALHGPAGQPGVQSARAARVWPGQAALQREQASLSLAAAEWSCRVEAGLTRSGARPAAGQGEVVRLRTAHSDLSFSVTLADAPGGADSPLHHVVIA